jgi:hypothetical protein
VVGSFNLFVFCYGFRSVVGLVVLLLACLVCSFVCRLVGQCVVWLVSQLVCWLVNEFCV